MNYLKYISKYNKDYLKNKTILISGSTGSIGKEIVNYLSVFDSNIILLGRNEELLENLRIQMVNKYHNNISYFLVDFENKNSIDNLLNYLKSNDIKIDIFISNHGIYHLKKKLINGIDNTFYVNYLSTIYLINNLIEMNKDIKVVSQVSISYHFIKKLNKNDFDLKNSKDLTKIYANSKYYLISYLLKLKELGNNIIMIHPGICYTNLFKKKNNAYSKLFYIFVSPLIKLIFLDPKKGSLSTIEGVFKDSLDYSYWIGPKIFGIWGKPKTYRLNKKILKKENIDFIYKLSNDILKKL